MLSVSSSKLLKYSVIKLLSLLPKHMSLHVLVAEHASGIYLLQDSHKIAEMRVHLTKRLGAEVMCFCPMWPSAVSEKNLFESRK